MKQLEQPIVKQSLFSWVLRSKMSLQLLLLAIILVMVFFRVLPLEIQKRIVNDVLSRGKVTLLLWYCLVYLVAVLLASGLKFAMNALQAVIGQRAMTDMRHDLYNHILRLQLSFFRKTQPGTVVTSLVSELATSGSFIGMAVAVPLSNVLTLVAFAVYLIWLNPLLGIISLSIYPIALLVVPLAQRGANKANKERVTVSQQMASQITESIIGIQEVHAHGSFLLEEDRYNTLIERLLKIRVVWTLYRYGVKVINNLFVGLGPVLVFILGGYLMMQGKMELGAIVAFLSAQEKLYDPWKELIEFYQVYQDSLVRYTKIMHIFDQPSDVHLLYDRAGTLPRLDGRIEVKDLTLATSEGIRLLDQVSLSVEAGEHVALVGFSGSGKSTLAGCISQLFSYTDGEVLLGGRPVAELSKAELAASLGYISQSPFIFTGTVNENLLYAHNALTSLSPVGEEPPEPSLDDKIVVLQQTGLFLDILRFGLNTIIDPDQDPELAQTLLQVRRNFQENFGQELAEHVEFYRQENYLYHSSIAENLIFGSPRVEDFKIDRLSGNDQFVAFLDSSNLYLPLVETGAELLLQTVDILGEVPTDAIFFEQTPINASDYAGYLELAERMKGTTTGQLHRDDKQRLLAIALRYIPAQHKIIALQPLLEKLILNGRKTFRSWCSENTPGSVHFYSDSHYLNSHSILNNIFFGTLTTDSPSIDNRVNQCIVHLLIEEDLLELVTEIGMNYHVGNKGDRLSGGQQQKLAIARVLLKRPAILVMDEATSALDNKSQARIQKIVAQWRGQCTVISVIHRLDMLPSFDRVAVLKAGKIIEQGNPQKLIADKGALHELIHGKSQ